MSALDIVGGVAKGAVKGASVGAIGGVPGAVIGGTIGAISGGLAGNKKGKYNDEINKQITAMQEGKQGMSAAQKSQEKRGVYDDAQRASAAAVGDVTEMGPAAGGSYQGQQAEALIGASKGAAEAAAQAAVQVDTNSAILAENRRKETMDAMAIQAGEARATEASMSDAAGAGLKTASGVKGLDPGKAADYATLASMFLAA